MSASPGPDARQHRRVPVPQIAPKESEESTDVCPLSVNVTRTSVRLCPVQLTSVLEVWLKTREGLAVQLANVNVSMKLKS